MTEATPSTPQGRYLATLSIAAMGVVYGDIGTSPLYALRIAFHGEHAIALTHANVVGVLSLIFWSLVIVISIKYVAFVMRADNKGEGGILALQALIQRGRIERKLKPRQTIVLLGIFGAALMYGDSVITPAISVTSAMEGLKVATPALEPFVIPLTLVILFGLFFIQTRGTQRVGALFGPVMILWFLTLSVLGVAQLLAHPQVLAAVSPYHAVRFLVENGRAGFLVLGAVFLVVTGGEALYADMGHFGVRPIRLAWYSLVLPGLLLNYFGQGALLLRNPAAAESPFFHLAPPWALYPLILLASLAAIIASQAVISGAFSLTRQAVQLGYSPRMRIEHTSSTEIGQIYMPGVNWSLMLVTFALVLGFQSSSNMAAAYGVAVSSEMVITSILFYILARTVWNWSAALAGTLAAFFLVMDVGFWTANALKIPQGGWFPVLIAAGVFLLMMTWKRGREILSKRLQEKSVPLNILMADLAADPPQRVPGIALFMSGNPGGTPPALVHNLAHNKVLHEKVIFLTVVTEEVPHVAPAERVTVKHLGKGFHSVLARYGFMEDPSIYDIIEHCRVRKLVIQVEGSTFFLGREELISTERPGMARWRERLFAFMSRNALRATAFFQIPSTQVFEVGAQVEL
jgi:KUP system potassium uptake protein